jgi:hypothetical protein
MPWPLTWACTRTSIGTNVVRLGGVDEAGWMLAVDSLLEVVVKEGILHVQLMDGPDT